MKRDTADLILGLGVLALGLAVLLFTFTSALALAAAPGTFFQDQLPSTAQPTGPTASFSWTSDGLNVTVQDGSQAGDASITSWEWDFGEGVRTTMPNPGIHTYANPGPYEITLTVRDGNGLTSRAFGNADLVPGQVRSGESMGDPSASLGTINFGLNDVLLPLGVGLLTVGLYIVMALIGGAIAKAGWNILKPRPETVRIRLKPKHLTQAFEADDASPTLPPPPA